MFILILKILTRSRIECNLHIQCRKTFYGKETAEVSGADFCGIIDSGEIFCAGFVQFWTLMRDPNTERIHTHAINKAITSKNHIVEPSHCTYAVNSEHFFQTRTDIPFVHGANNALALLKSLLHTLRSQRHRQKQPFFFSIFKIFLLNLWMGPAKVIPFQTKQAQPNSFKPASFSWKSLKFNRYLFQKGKSSNFSFSLSWHKVHLKVWRNRILHIKHNQRQNPTAKLANQYPALNTDIKYSTITIETLTLKYSLQTKLPARSVTHDMYVPTTLIFMSRVLILVKTYLVQINVYPACIPYVLYDWIEP